MSDDLTITVKIGDEEHTATLSERRKEQAVELLWMLEQVKDRLGSDVAAAEIMKIWVMKALIEAREKAVKERLALSSGESQVALVNDFFEVLAANVKSRLSL